MELSNMDLLFPRLIYYNAYVPRLSIIETNDCSDMTPFSKRTSKLPDGKLIILSTCEWGRYLSSGTQIPVPDMHLASQSTVLLLTPYYKLNCVPS